MGDSFFMVFQEHNRPRAFSLPVPSRRFATVGLGFTPRLMLGSSITFLSTSDEMEIRFKSQGVFVLSETLSSYRGCWKTCLQTLVLLFCSI
jgi:hypothetical protein